MATEKDEKTAETTKEKTEKKVKEPKEPKAEKKVTIKLPKTKEKTGPLFVSVNERTFLIQRGVSVSVPECVAEEIARSERAEDEALEFEEAART